ncbi:hypothetical protein CDAR_441521 [Caerostris darwini]|uniref:Uncharacterized protein n=1 Tax=Caerostris darwini TaxID=1538125 RepID=A0AAV4NQ93_9ARAC|nr:hypothetical protein CDAR_441521 [Caerostris darwini]
MRSRERQNGRKKISSARSNAPGLEIGSINCDEPSAGCLLESSSEVHCSHFKENEQTIFAMYIRVPLEMRSREAEWPKEENIFCEIKCSRFGNRINKLRRAISGMLVKHLRNRFEK